MQNNDDVVNRNRSTFVFFFGLLEQGLYPKATQFKQLLLISFHFKWLPTLRLNLYPLPCFRDLTKLEEGLGEKVVMFVYFMVGFISSITLALVKGWQLALICMASLPVTFIVVGVVSVVNDDNYC